jgi:hypothetical protein
MRRALWALAALLAVRACAQRSPVLLHPLSSARTLTPLLAACLRPDASTRVWGTLASPWRQQASSCSAAGAKGAATNAAAAEGDATRGAAVQPPQFFALGDNPLAWDDDVLSRGARADTHKRSAPTHRPAPSWLRSFAEGAGVGFCACVHARRSSADACLRPHAAPRAATASTTSPRARSAADAELFRLAGASAHAPTFAHTHALRSHTPPPSLHTAGHVAAHLGLRPVDGIHLPTPVNFVFIGFNRDGHLCGHTQKHTRAHSHTRMFAAR